MSMKKYRAMLRAEGLKPGLKWEERHFPVRPQYPDRPWKPLPAEQEWFVDPWVPPRPDNCPCCGQPLLNGLTLDDLDYD